MYGQQFPFRFLLRRRYPVGRHMVNAANAVLDDERPEPVHRGVWYRDRRDHAEVGPPSIVVQLAYPRRSPSKNLMCKYARVGRTGPCHGGLA